MREQAFCVVSEKIGDAEAEPNEPNEDRRCIVAMSMTRSNRAA